MAPISIEGGLFRGHILLNNKNKYQCVGFFDRVMRFYRQLEAGHNGVPFKLENRKYDTNTVTDRFLTFFIFCHHIKDWIINDDLVDHNIINEDNVESFVNANLCLQNCADIANGIKHLKRNRKRRSPILLRSIKSQRIIVPAKLSDIKRINPHEDLPILIKDFASINTDQGTIDAFDLATECVEKWRKFIEDNICNL